MHRSTALSKCPSCEEPLETGDRFCGACGYDLSAVPPPPADPPTNAVNGWAPQPSPQTARSDGPAAVPGTQGGAPSAPVPAGAPGAGPDGFGLPQDGVRFDRPAGSAESVEPVGPTGSAEPTGSAGSAEPDDYPLAAPQPPAAPPVVVPPRPEQPPADPRTAEPPTPPAGTKLCVACRAGRVDTDGYCENCGHAQPRERDHMEQELGAVAAVSDRGLRHHRNEDAFAVSSTALPDGSPAVVAVVCDGVSSATRPDEASLAAAATANEALLAALPLGTHPQQAMHDAIVAAAHAVTALADGPGQDDEHAPHQNAPACTIVGAVVTPALLVVGWIGDSRAYWVPVDRSAPPARLTEDDSWAAQMVAAGLMNEAEAYADDRAHAITGWLGADAYELEPHTAAFKPDRPGAVVVCTDGLWNYAEAAEEMAAAVPLDAAERPLHAARVLVGHALDGGGHDNVTVAVLPFPAPPQGAGSA
ncbi:hypothetical protein GCM10010358_00050 [Streptomyces minutiscleroticus]|uniref:PPM-type phosphatase domain-containing protein n=2 Tax=Streptomyces minutiscleroticus TaxID=68238 RepID=A0A918K767_9ACTN|nr:hypothetical protein GCM10010358_00050 [Streptomyces minutiscleroticus]